MCRLMFSRILALVVMGSSTLPGSGQCFFPKETFPLDPSSGSDFGCSVAVHGKRIAVGAMLADGLFPDSGSAYVFERDGSASDEWIQVRKLTGDFTQLAQFGSALAVQGETVLVGLPDDLPLEGKVHAYERNLGGPAFWGFASIMPSVSPSSGFGTALSMDSSTLIVGRTAYSAFVYERSAPGIWTETQALTTPDASQGDNYGTSVYLSGDTALVGSRRGDNCGIDFGAAYVFERNLGGPNNWGESRILCPSNPGFDDRFGGAVVVDGDTAVVSSFLEDTQAVDAGAVYVFYRDLGGLENWGELKMITAPDGADNDWFGQPTGLALQHDTLLVGATGHDAAGPNAGAVYVFERDLGGADNWGLFAKVNGFRPGQEFGKAIAIDGNVTVVGAPMDDTHGPGAGAVYVFEEPWTPSGFATYCTPGTSAFGCQAVLSAFGTASATQPIGFVLRADQVEGTQDGIFFFSTNGKQANTWGNGTSYQCVLPPVTRTPLKTGTGTQFQCNGFLAIDMNAHWTQKPSHNPGAGALVQTQLWYRDPLSTSNQSTSLSNAGEFGVCP